MRPRVGKRARRRDPTRRRAGGRGVPDRRVSARLAESGLPLPTGLPDAVTLSAAMRPAVQGRAHAARDAGFGALAGWEGR